MTDLFRHDDLARSRVESLLPLMCQLLAIEVMKKQGFEIREDMETALRRAVGVIVGKLDHLIKVHLAQQTYRFANDILKEHSLTPPQLLVAAALFSVKLTAEGLLPDPQSQATLVGLSFVNEAKNDETGEWGYQPGICEAAAGRMLDK